MSDSLWPHGLQHTRLLSPPLSPRVYSVSCPFSWWCYLTISSSTTPFSFCLQSFPASGSFPMSWLFVLSGQSIGASVSASILPVNTQGWFPLGLTGLISLHPRDCQESSPVPQFKSINSKSFIFLAHKNKTKNHLDFLGKNIFLGNFNVITVASLLVNFRSIMKSTVLMKMLIFLGSSMQNLSAAQLTVVEKFLPFLLAVRFSCRWNSIVSHQNRPWLSS